MHSLRATPDAAASTAVAFSLVDVNHGVFATGTLSGITNAGTHRAPFEPSCQPCHAPGFMEGHFCGVIRRSTADPALLGCQVFGSYKLEFQGALQDERNPVRRGVFEGLIVCECQPTEPPAS